jgi:ribose transport system permease protein
MKEKAKGYSILAVMIIATYLIFKIMQPARFGSPDSMFILVQQSFLQSVAACGFYFILTMGMFDFSIGANIILSAIVGCLLSTVFGYAGLLFGGIAVGAVLGLANGILYTRLKIPSIIITVGLLIIYECIGTYVCGGSVLTLDPVLRELGRAPYNVIISVIAFVLAYFLLRYTKVGVYISAIGSNETIAKNMGVNIDRYKTIGFMLCGLFAGIMSVVVLSYGSSVAPAINMNSMARNFTPIMGCFIGIALRKYVNPILAIIVGEFVISMIVNGLMTNGIDATLQDVVVGFTLLIIVGLTSVTSKKYEVVK